MASAAELPLLVRDSTGRTRAVLLSGGEQASVGQLATALGARDLSVAGSRLDPALPVLEAGLVPGTLLGADTAALEAPPAPDGGLELAVIGGPAAGSTRALRAGAALTVGRDPSSGLRVDDPEVSRRHALVEAGPEGVRLTDNGSTNGVRWQGFRLTGEAAILPGDAFAVGESVVALRTRSVGRQRVEQDAAAGRLRWNRPPRVRPPSDPPERTVPAPPDEPTGRHIPLVVALLPAVLGVLLYFVVDFPVWTLAFLAMSPVIMLASSFSDRRSGRKTYKKDLAAHTQAMADLHAELDVLARQEERDRRDASPDPATLVDLALAPGARLWERRPADADFLKVRLGLADAPSRTVLSVAPGGRTTAEVPTPVCRLVPVEVPLGDLGVLGLAGERAPLLRLARAALAGTAALHAPRDLSVVVLTGADDAADWEWATWLPHAEPFATGDTPSRLLATDGPQAANRVAELLRLVEERSAESNRLLRSKEVQGRRVLLVLDGARRLRAVPGLPELLRDGPAVGVVAVCLDTDEGSLPDECRAVVSVGGKAGTRLTVRLPDGPPHEDVIADGLSVELATRQARALAPLRVLGGGEGGEADLPDRVRLLDLLGSTDLRERDVLASWARTGGRTTQALIGVGPQGPLTVDLRKDGPHALVAGTSGSGKSELLQTLVASLALGNTPESLSFVLIDYKGGAAFAACADLPHVTGLVTDLDGTLVARALASLDAELKRREHVLAAAGAKDIDDFLARGGRLPRLVIVVDEFASLVEEVPEFVQGVVGIGMRGRSLGVHVVLATQRPGGVVNAEIRANVNLRLCLRVTSSQESADVIDSPEAGKLPRSLPGRAYLRTGHGELVPLQSARIGWPRPDVGAVDATRPAVTIRERDLTRLGDIDVAQSGPEDGAEVTDLTVLVAAVRAAADTAGVSGAASPWLPPLPELVSTGALEPAARTNPVTVALGLADQPSRQAQPTFVLDLERTGAVAVGGTSRSGRSTVLRTLAAGLVSGAGPWDVHLYALDCGGRALGPLELLPHCGAVVDGDDEPRVGRLLSLLEDEVSRRQRVLAAGGFGSIGEQRAGDPQRALPHVVLLVDRLEAFSARYAEMVGGRYTEQLEGLLRHGASVGITTVLTSDRSGFTYRLSGAVESRLVLRQADRDDAASFGLGGKDLPETMPIGRAVWSPTLEHVQVAVLGSDPSGAAQSTVLRELADRLAAAYIDVPGALRPRRVDPLPEKITLAEATGRRREPAPALLGGCVPVVGGDEAGPVDLDLLDIGGFLVSGPSRSGRSTALATVARSLQGRVPVVVVAPRAGAARDLAGEPGVLAVLGADDADDLEDLLAEHIGPLAVLVDDAEMLVDGRMANLLEDLARTGRDVGRVIVAAGSTEDLQVARFRGWVSTVRRSRCGLLLTPSGSNDGELFDLRLPRGTGPGTNPGRGLLVLHGQVQPAQVPLS